MNNKSDNKEICSRMLNFKNITQQQQAQYPSLKTGLLPKPIRIKKHDTIGTEYFNTMTQYSGKSIGNIYDTLKHTGNSVDTSFDVTVEKKESDTFSTYQNEI